MRKIRWATVSALVVLGLGSAACTSPVKSATKATAKNSTAVRKFGADVDHRGSFNCGSHIGSFHHYTKKSTDHHHHHLRAAHHDCCP